MDVAALQIATPNIGYANQKVKAGEGSRALGQVQQASQEVAFDDPEVVA